MAEISGAQRHTQTRIMTNPTNDTPAADGPETPTTAPRYTATTEATPALPRTCACIPVDETRPAPGADVLAADVDNLGLSPEEWAEAARLMEDEASLARIQDADSDDAADDGDSDDDGDRAADAWPVDIQAGELPLLAHVGQEPPYGRATVSANGAP